MKRYEVDAESRVFRDIKTGNVAFELRKLATGGWLLAGAPTLDRELFQDVVEWLGWLCDEIPNPKEDF